MEKRICAYFDYRGRVFIEEEPIPELKEGEVLVKVNASLISPGTEVGGIKKLRESQASSKLGKRPFGYSISGEIVEVCKNCKSLKI
ncbi:MAG: hypothetical protein ACK4F0_03775, partial [Candidatus Ratteibacteria bacterium]